MRPNFASLIGVGVFLLALWRAWRVRRDLATGQTKWESALFGRRDPVLWSESPVKFWCAIVVNAVIVLLITLVGAAMMRLAAFSAR